MLMSPGRSVTPLDRELPGRPGSKAVDGSRGRILVLGGVGGLDFLGIALRYAARVERLPYAVDVFAWGHGFGRWLADLTDIAARDRQAARLAEEIVRHRAERPDVPLFLIARSAGAGIAVMALERLGADLVECVVLLAPALSPAYDLTGALRAVRREMVVFWSPLDMIILGAGTRLFGTIDRVRTVAAGLAGFAPPLDGDSRQDRSLQYRKLRQVRWRPAMAALGYFGGHFGTDCPCFLRKYVVPILQVAGGPDVSR